jgi:F-type H+-transporting ATPase subunit b
MRFPIGLNSNLVETNIGNLVIVLRITRNVVGDAVKESLSARRSRLEAQTQQTKVRQQSIYLGVVRAEEVRAKACRHAEKIHVNAEHSLNTIQRAAQARKEEMTLLLQLQRDLQMNQQELRTERSLLIDIVTKASSAAEKNLLLKFKPQHSLTPELKTFHVQHINATLKKWKAGKYRN